jgi:allantoicase
MDKAQKDVKWTLILSRTKLGPHRRHFFQLENVQDQDYSHVKLTIYPDGGIKRVRIIGHRMDGGHESQTGFLTSSEPRPTPLAVKSPSVQRRAMYIPVFPLTADAFKGFGQVIQAYADLAAAPRGMRVTAANGGTARKFHKVALTNSSYPVKSNASTGLSIYRCQPVKDVASDRTWEITTLERHLYTNQAFIPMGCSETGGDDGLESPGSWYLVVVAKNGPDDRPDLATLKAFMATAGQGVMYDKAVWREFHAIDRDHLCGTDLLV